MKLLLAALAASLLAPRADTLAFSVTKGTKLTKTFEAAFEFVAREISITLDGQEMPPEVAKKFEASMSNRIELVVEDEYGEIEAGRPTELVRSFQTVKSHVKAHSAEPGRKPADRDETLESPLAGRAVLFHWNAKEEEWERSFKGEPGDEKALAPLKPDMDFLALLHPGALEEGATWKIDPKFVGDLTKPGGELAFPQPKGSSMHLEFGKNPSGTIEATYAGTREVDGRKLGRITLEFHVQTVQAADPDQPGSFALEGTLELEGEYLWDLEHGRLASFEVHGPATLVASAEREVESKGRKIPMKLRFDFAGELQAKGSID